MQGAVRSLGTANKFSCLCRMEKTRRGKGRMTILCGDDLEAPLVLLLLLQTATPNACFHRVVDAVH